MALEVNGARGEVPLTVGSVELVIAATMAGLAATSTRLQCKSMSDLFERLSGVEPAATLAAIDCLTIRGDKQAALAAITLKDFPSCAGAFAQALNHHFDGEPKNANAVRKK